MAIIMYKLISQRWTSHGAMEWEIGKTNYAKILTGNELCSEEVLHCYSDPYLAVLFNPIHTCYDNPRLLEIEVDEIVATDGLKYGTKKQTPIRELRLPKITLQQKTAFAILCAKAVYTESSFIAWADAWLTGKDRTYAAATKAAKTATATASTSWAARAARAAWAAAAASRPWAASAAAAAAAASTARALSSADAHLNFRAIFDEACNLLTANSKNKNNT